MHANKNGEEKLILFLLRSFFRINFSRTLADCYISKRREREKLTKASSGHWAERTVCFIVFNFS